MPPVMETILAHWYWHYFQQNRWRFMQRTRDRLPAGQGFYHLGFGADLGGNRPPLRHRPLAPEAELKAIKVASTTTCWKKARCRTHRPTTLYDFLAHEALEFYASGEQAGQAEDAFELGADSPIFGSADDFVAWEPKTTDQQSPTLKAVRLYQALFSSTPDDQDNDGLAGCRPVAARVRPQQGRRRDEDARYKAALKHFVDRWGDHEVSALARYLWAVVLQQENDLVEAHELAEQGREAFAATFGGQAVRQPAQPDRGQVLPGPTERVWNAPLPNIVVHDRNVTKIYFRAVRYDWCRAA